MSGKHLGEERADAFVESYSREAELLEKVIVHMERERALLEAGDFVALCDCLAGRGEIVDEIARLEARRRELETAYSGFTARHAQGVDSQQADSLREQQARAAEEAQERAAAVHRRVLKTDEGLRQMFKARRAELEKALADLAQGRAANRAYNGHRGYRSASVFLDKER